MASGTSVRFNFSGDKLYISDLSETGISLASGFRLPTPCDGVTKAQLEAVASSVGAKLGKYAGNVVNEFSSACPVRSILQPRKLVVIYTTGSGANAKTHTASIAFSQHTNALTAAKSLKTSFGNIDGVESVDCIKLKGEYWKRTNAYITLNFKSSSVTNSAGIGAKYSLRHNFVPDWGDSTELLTWQTPSFKGSPPGSDPPPIFEDSIDDCLDKLESAVSCAGASQHSSRKFGVSYQADEEGNFEERSIHVSNNETSDIIACGESLVTESVVCITYEGASYDGDLLIISTT